MSIATASSEVSNSNAAEQIDALWSQVVGQPDLVASLRAAARAPVHAYLIVGPEGSGKRAAANAFAAELVGRDLEGEEADRAVRLVAAGIHPSVSLVQREGARILVDVARDIVRRAALAPSEGRVQVFILDEFHLVDEAAPMLLKSIEEPAPTTVFVVLAEEISDGLVTIASRCVQLQTAAVPTAEIERQLVENGTSAEAAAEAARSAGGSLRRAQLLAGDPRLVQRRQTWRDARAHLDGTGSAVGTLSEQLLGGIDDVLAPLEEAHEAELAAFDEMAERTGTPRKGERNALEARHKREARRLRVAELRGGLAAMLDTYREDAIEGGPDAAERFVEAASAVQRLTDALRFNPNEGLALRALLLRLPLEHR